MPYNDSIKFYSPIARSINASKFKFDAFTVHTPFGDNDGTSGLKWRLLLLHDRLCTGGDSPGFWFLTLRTFNQRKSEQCFCKDTAQTCSCSTMQFTEACHRQNIKTPLFPDLTGSVTNLEMVARQSSYSPSWPYNGSEFEHLLIQSSTCSRLYKYNTMVSILVNIHCSELYEQHLT